MKKLRSLLTKLEVLSVFFKLFFMGLGLFFFLGMGDGGRNRFRIVSICGINAGLDGL